MDKKLKIAVVAILIVATLLSAATLFPQQQSPSLSLLSVSNTSIAPQGSENQATHEWTGSFWTVLATTDMNDQYAMYKFNNAQAEQYGNNKISGKTLTPTSEITVKITPLRPYWERALDVQAVTVYPLTKTAHSSYSGISFGWENPTTGPFSVPVAKWGQQYWTAHTPFQIDIYKDGAQIATETIDTSGITQTVMLRNVNDQSEWIAIKDLGKLGTGYSAPTIGDIAIMAPDLIFKDVGAVVNYLDYYGNSDYSFSNYWFGGGNYYKYLDKVMQKANDGSPGLFYRTDGPISYNAIPQQGNFPGIYRQQGGLTDVWAKPLGAKIFENQASGTQQTEGRVFQKDGLSVVNYLKDVRGLPTFSLNDMNVWQQGWEITAERKVRIYLPYGSMSSLITMQISTELADTVVWQPPVSDIEITGLSWVASSTGQIGDRDLLKIDLLQKSSIQSTSTITTQCTTGQEINVNPTNQAVTLGPGVSTSMYVEVLNTGAAVEKTGTLTVKVTNALGSVTSTDSIQYTLLPKGVQGSVLTLMVKDKKTGLLVTEPVVIGISWGTAHSQTITTTGGTCTLDMQGYQGTASLTSIATDYHQAMTPTSIQIKGGYQTEYVELLPIGATDTDWLMTILVVISIVSVIAIIVYAIYKKRKR
ncbi:MAG: hypothetical protein WC325_09330 [Candidatus Bathyarchaeia archaeon]